MRFFLPGLFGVVLLLSGFSLAQAQQEKAVPTLALLPFSAEQAGSYAYLEEAIRQMLIARLANRDDVDISARAISKRQAGEVQALLGRDERQQAAQLIPVDWLATGEIVALQQGLRVNLVLVPLQAAGERQPLGFTATDIDTIVPAVAQLAETVAEHLQPRQETAEVGPQPSAAADDGFGAFQTPHPERSFKKGLYSGSALTGDGDDRFQSRGVRRSSPLPIDVETMTSGDLDGDGIDDLVVASRSQIRVFHFSDERFQQVASYDFPPVIKIHVINIGKPDQSDLPHLFVSANNGWKAASAILGWDGSATLQPLQQNLDWYIRPISWPGRGEILAGQQASRDEGLRYLASGVFRLSMDRHSGQLTSTERLPLPADTNLFDFAVADFNGDGSNETAVIDERHRLLVYDETRSLVWVSSATYGGSLRHFGPILTETTADDTAMNSTDEEGMRRLVYIPGRLDVKDITGDGVAELIIVTNEVDPVSKYLPNIRSYDGGSVACLGWRGAGLTELWRTSHIAGYVADYVFAGSSEAATPSTVDAISRLYVAQLPDKALWRRFLPGGDNSRILAYEMRVAPQ